MKRYNKDGFHAEHGEGALVLYEDAKREIDELKTRLAEAEAQRGGLKVALEQANTKLSCVRDELYGRGFEVLGWHLNGATERLDSWFESNDWEPVPCEALAKLED